MRRRNLLEVLDRQHVYEVFTLSPTNSLYMQDVHLHSAHNVPHRVYCHVMSVLLPVSGLADPNTTRVSPRGCLKYKIEHGPDFAQGLVRSVCYLVHDDDEIDSAVRVVSRGARRSLGAWGV